MDKEKQIKRQNTYIAEKYDRFTMTFPRGKKEEYRQHAAASGQSLNSLIAELLENDIKQRKQ